MTIPWRPTYRFTGGYFEASQAPEANLVRGRTYEVASMAEVYKELGPMTDAREKQLRELIEKGHCNDTCSSQLGDYPRDCWKAKLAAILSRPEVSHEDASAKVANYSGSSLILIFDEILDERQAQDIQWGGPGHDDQHDQLDWRSFIQRHNDKAAFSFRRQMIRVAALAVSAILSYDRKRHLAEGNAAREAQADAAPKPLSQPDPQDTELRERCYKWPIEKNWQPGLTGFVAFVQQEIARAIERSQGGGAS